MFLWVHLVLLTLERVHSVQQLNDVVRDLPKGLETVYENTAHYKVLLLTHTQDTTQYLAIYAAR
jgi:hypothetical protein